MNRSQRRAAMHLTQTSVQTPALNTTTKIIPEAIQIAAAVIAETPQPLIFNPANPKNCTGPKTEEGRAISRMNALKTGLTGRTILIPGEDAAEYEAFVLDHEKLFNPVGVIEAELVQSIADSAWRLRRISTLEFALYAKGRIDFAEQFKGQHPAFLDLHTLQTYEKGFRNLHLQESRLTRRREKEMAELRAHQAARVEKEEAALAAAAAAYVAAEKAGTTYIPTPDENNFVFSTAEIRRYLAATSGDESENSAKLSRSQRAAASH